MLTVLPFHRVPYNRHLIHCKLITEKNCIVLVLCGIVFQQLSALPGSCLSKEVPFEDLKKLMRCCCLPDSGKIFQPLEFGSCQELFCENFRRNIRGCLFLVVVWDLRRSLEERILRSVCFCLWGEISRLTGFCFKLYFISFHFISFIG